MTQKRVVPDVVQTFYDSMASQYDRFYLDWDETVREEASFLDGLLAANGHSRSSRVLDCACGIGTQAIGLALLGYDVTASDISKREIEEARRRAKERGATVRFKHADFRFLSDAFPQTFDVVIAMDNALPHMPSHADLDAAVESIASRVGRGGIFVASIRDYDAILKERPTFSPPYVHKTESGQRVLFQTWDWEDDRYRFVQYIIEDEGEARLSKFECQYRAVRRCELAGLLETHGFDDVQWKMPDETGFYQPIVIARKA